MSEIAFHGWHLKMNVLMQPAVHSAVLQLKLWFSPLLALLPCYSMNQGWETNTPHFQTIISITEKASLCSAEKKPLGAEWFSVEQMSGINWGFLLLFHIHTIHNSLCSNSSEIKPTGLISFLVTNTKWLPQIKDARIKRGKMAGITRTVTWNELFD